MNKIPGPSRLKHQRSPQGKVSLGFTFVLAAVLFSAGCGKGKSSSPQVSAPPAAQDTNQVSAPETTPTTAPASVSEPAPATGPSVNSRPTAAAPAVAAPAVAANAGPDLGEMDRALLRWLSANQRRPNSFEDFAATAGISIPPPPQGKKYIINKRMHIELVNQ